MNVSHYLPILKAKLGELKALEGSTALVRGGLTPLWEVPPIDWDWDKAVPKKSLDAHVDAVVAKLAPVMGATEAFIDVQALDDEALSSGDHPLLHICRALTTGITRAVPVLHVPMSVPELNAVVATIAVLGPRVMLRIAPELFDDAPSTVTRSIADLLAKLGIAITAADVLLDWGSVEGQPAGVLALAIRGVLSAHPVLSSGRSLVLAASAFPPDLSRVPRSSTTGLARTEWDVWYGLYHGRAGLTRLPTFGDYSIAHPDFNELDPRMIRMSAQLRYTMRDEWVVAKGRSVRTFGFEQFLTLCASIAADPDFSGAAFSWGDNYIASAAAGTEKRPGNATTWRQIGSSHHLAFVVGQLAALAWP